MNNKSKNIIFKISNMILFIATIFQIVVFMVKGAFLLAGISLGLILILIIYILYKTNQKVKVMIVFLMGLYLLENIIMTYLYVPSIYLPIILFIVEIIIDIAIIQNMILNLVIKDSNSK